MQTIALTSEQQKFAEENHNLIFSFMQKFSLSCDEWYDVAAIGFCKAVTKYNPQKGTAFSSYAYHIMLNDVRMEMRKAKALKRNAPVVSLQSELCEGFALEETLAHDSHILDSILCYEATEYINTLKPRYQIIISLLLAGKRQCEIAERIGITQTQVSRDIKTLKKKFIDEYLYMKGKENGIFMHNKYK